MNYLKNRYLIICYACIIFSLFACKSNSTYSTHFYVSNSGNDRNSGTSPEKPWKTISKVNSQNFKPGDSIFFKRGDVWRNELLVKHSGSKNNPIVYTAYGVGERPKIIGSENCKDFSKTNIENIWISKANIENPNTAYAGSIFFELQDTTLWGRKQKDYDANFSQLKQEFDWCWQDGNIYIYSNENPNNKYINVEVAQRDHAITLKNPVPDYITIDGIQTSYTKRRIIYCEYPAEEAYGLTIRNCEVSFVGIKNGMSAYGIFTYYSNLLIENNLIHDCGRRGISYTVYKRRGLNLEDIYIQNNTFYNGYHTTAIDCQIASGKESEIGDTLRNFHFRNNIIFNDPNETLQLPEGNTSNDIFFQVEDTTGGKGGYISNVYIYNNIISHSKSRAILINYCDSVFVWNNTIYGSSKADRGSTNKIWGMVSFHCTSNIDFRNNIIYGNANYEKIGPATCLFAEENQLNTYWPKFFHFDNNLFYQEDSLNQGLIYYRPLKGTSSVRMYSFNGDQSWKLYVNQNKLQNQNSPKPTDPLFIDAKNNNFKLKENSSARNAGDYIPLINKEINEQKLSSSPDLGAIQHYK